MARAIRSLLVIAVLPAVLLVAFGGSSPSAVAATCTDGAQPSGAVYRVCMPDSWNGSLVVWAHGYVSPFEPVGIPEGQLVLPDGTSLPDIVNGLGFAFATTSYRDNGLAVKVGVDDLLELMDIFVAGHGEPNRTYLVGASEGGVITALATEQHPEVFDGGLAACGPVGDFQQQINYFGDFRAVFDYYFPGVIPGDPTDIPQEVIDNWDSVYEPAVVAAISSNGHATEQLINVTHASVDANDLHTVIETVTGLLWYNVYATNDGIAKLGGQPFDNHDRLYLGSDDDVALNLGVERVTADAAALAEVEAHYQTSGSLSSPIVTIHTTGDPIVPYHHEWAYRIKTFFNGPFWMHINAPIDRYGHCQFEASEVLLAFLVLAIQVELQG
jgi:pimeloyl-ACP methyl ester carboxylesterase